jgi:hypothetical protein
MPYAPTDIAGQNPLVPGQAAGNDGTSNALGMQDSVAVLPTEHRLAQLGRMFLTTNATIGTAVARAASGAGNNTFVSTDPTFTIQNTGSTTAGQPTNRAILLRVIDLLLGGTAPTATNTLEVAVFISNVSRAPTSGNVAATPVNVRGFAGIASIAAINAFSAADMAVPADATAKLVARGRVAMGLGVLGDVYKLVFGGGIDPTSGGGGALRTTTTSPGTFMVDLPPVLIEPGEWCTVYTWMPSAATNPQSYEWSIRHAEL